MIEKHNARMESEMNPLPAVLYKYRSDSERTAGILKDQTLWLATAETLNDPLECRTGTIPEQWRRETIKEMEVGQIMGVIAPLPSFQPPDTLFTLSPRGTRRWLKTFHGLSHEDRLKAMRKLYAKHGIDLSRPDKIFQSFMKQLASIGVLSLSCSATNELMWAHYADSHRGLVLGFGRTEHSKLADPLHTMPVAYRNEKPIFKTGFLNQIEVGFDDQGRQVSRQRMSFDDPVFRAAFSTKPEAWAYEQEWRYIEETSGAFPWPGPLLEVVFGIRMPEDRRQHYKRLAVEDFGTSVKFFEIAMANDAGSFLMRPYE